MKCKSDSPLNLAIAGGGLLGRLCAWRLSLAGHQVTVFEAGKFNRPQGACWTAAGMISPLSELVSAEYDVFHKGMKGLTIWPRWAAELEEQSGQSVGYSEAGSLLVAHALDYSELDQFYSHLAAALKKLDTGNTVQCNDAVTRRYEAVKNSRWLNRKEIAETEPGLGPFEKGLYLEPEAHLHTRDLLTILHELLLNSGVAIVEDTPVECEPGAILTNTGTQCFDQIIDVRGMGAKTALPELRGVRGEVMIVETSEVSLTRPVRLLHPRYKLYVVPRRNHQFIIGATEIESEDYSPISLQSTLELSSALYSLNPAFAEARVLETQANCRPALPNNLPEVQIKDGLVRANGLFRHGYLLSPVVVEEILSAFSVSPASEANVDPSYPKENQSAA